jgi:hypothetical protein
MLLILLSLLCSICGQAQNQTVETKKVQGDNQQEKMLGIDANDEELHFPLAVPFSED